MSVRHESTIFRINGRDIEIRSLDIKMVKLISLGYTYPEIATKLHYSGGLVSKDIALLRKRTRTSNAAQLVAFFLRNGIIE